MSSTGRPRPAHGTDRCRLATSDPGRQHDRRMRRPSPLPPQLSSVPFTTADALAAGVTPRRLRSKSLMTPFRGVRVDGGTRATLVDRCKAYAVIMPAGQVFFGPTAAVLSGIPLPMAVERDSRLHVASIDGSRAPRRRGVVGSSTSASPRLVDVPGVHGARMTAPADTWCSLSASLGLDDLIAAGDRLLGLPRPLASFGEIDDARARHGRRPGATRLSLARREIRPNVYSRRETFTRLSIMRAGLPEPEPNGMIVLRSGRRTRGDLVFRRYRVLVEYEGEQHLFDVDQWTTDVARLNDLIDDSWWVIRITKRMRRTELISRTARALRERGWQGEVHPSK